MQLTPKRPTRLLIGLGVLVSTALGETAVAVPTAALSKPAPDARLPVDFIENRGQWPEAARFVARGAGVVAVLEDQSIALTASGGQTPSLRLTFEGGRVGVRPAGDDRHGRYNFYLGSDSAKWRSDVPAFGRVVYKGLYDGIDLLVREEAGRLEYDLVLAPGADLDRVAVACDGVSALAVASDGSLVMRTPTTSLRQTPPRTWEVLPNGERRPLASGFRILGPQRYGFEAPGRDAHLALVVDPGIEWSTFLGGSSGDWIGPVEPARDGTGDVFVGGTTRSTDFPLFADPNFSSLGIQDRVFVARLNATGSAVVYATFLGGWHSQLVFRGLAADAGGNAVICGQSFSPDFPTTSGAPDRVGENKDGFVVRLNPSGALIFSTYLGGSSEDLATAVAYDPAGNVIVGGTTTSSDFPTTAGSFDPTYNVPNAPADGGAHGDMFVTRLNPTGTQITYSTFIGGPQSDNLEDLVVDSAGIVTVAGWVTGNNVQVFVTTPGAFDATWNGSQDGAIARLKLDGAGAADLKYATLIGGAGQDNLWSVALDPTNPELVTFAGRSWFSDYPVTPGVVKPTNPGFSELFPNNEAGVITRFRFPAAGGGTLVWSTYHHGKRITGVTVNAAGEPIVVGPEASWTLVTTRGAFDRTANGVAGVGTRGEAFIARLDANATQYVYQSFLGGSESEEDLFQVVPSVSWVAGNTVVVSGQTNSPDFPTTPGAFDTSQGNPDGSSIDGYVTKIALDADASGDLTADPPTLIQPADGAVFRNNALVRLKWIGVIDPSGVADYEFELSTQSSFPTTGIAFRGAVSGTEAIVPPSGVPEVSLSQSTWFWRMRTADRAGNLSAWSPTRTFTVSATSGQPVVSGVAVVPSSIVGGVTSPTGAVYLYDPAPAGGTVVELSLHHSRTIPLDKTRTLPIPASVPATVTVPAGAYSVAFPIATTAVSQNMPLSIVATAAGLGTQGAFTVSTPETRKPTSMTFVPWMLEGGTPATGTFTLDSAAPAGGTVVTLVSSHPAAASVPASVTVPAGASSASFPVTTSPVTVETDVLIQAKTAVDYWWNNLYVRPPGLPTLTGMTISPASVAGGGTTGGTLTFSGPIPLGTWPARPDGLVQFVSSDPEVANVFPGDGFVAAGASSSTFRIYTRGGPAARTVTLSAVFDGVTLSRPLTVGAVTGVTVSSITGNATSLSGGQGGLATVTLGAPAPTTILLTISTSHPSLFTTLPATAVIFSGETSMTFGYVSNKTATTPTAVTVTAAFGASSRNLPLTIGPPAEAFPPVVSVTLNPASVPSGGTSTGTATLQSAAPPGGAVVQLSSGNPSIATVPPSVTVAAAATSATFAVTAQTVASTQTVSIWGLTTLSAAGALTVTSGTPAPTLSSLALNPTTVTSGATSTGTATLSAAAPSGGQVVSLTSNNPAVAAVPASVTVAAGATSATFPVTTGTVAAATVVTITGVSGGATRTADLTVNPPPPNTGLRSPTANAADTGGDGNGFEVSPANAQADDAANAVDNDSGTQASTSCTSSTRDKHRFFNYGLNVPAGSAVQGIEVRLDAQVDSTSGAPKLCVQLSWNGGASWTAAKATPTLSTSMASYVLGGGADTWGRTWSAAELADANFRVRVITTANSTNRDFSLDWIPVRVTAAGGTPDTTPPTVSITSPTAGSTVSGTVAISAMASDNVGVTKVDFLVDGALLSSDTTSPYSATWNTTTAANGSHTLTAKAFDAANNQTTSAPVGVTVNNAPPPPDTTPPTVSITSPAAGATVSGTITISATASDNVGVTKVDFLVDGALLSTDTTAPYSAPWNTTTATNGSHTLSARAFDAANNQTTSAPVGVTVSNTAAPTLTVTATGRGGERVSSSPAGIDVAVGQTQSASFAAGTSITLSATNGRDVIWSGICSSNGQKARTCTFTLNANASETANVQ